MMNHLDAMKSQILKRTQVNFGGKIARSSGSRIPAITNMVIATQDFNKYLEEIGIFLRMPPVVAVEANKLKNANRYMEHQIIRMRRYSEINPRLSGAIAFFCIKSSISFRISAGTHVVPRGHYEMAQQEIYKINRKVSKIINNGDDDLLFKRTYIPKKSDQGRPLGVPSLEGRIVLHMGNNMIQIMMSKHILESQHGFIPGRGTLSAGREVITKVMKAKYVFECDLKGFFDNVNVTTITDILEKANVPKRIVYYIENINRNTPKLQDKDLTDESVHRDKERTYKGLKSEISGTPEMTMMESVQGFINDNGRDILEMLAQEEGCESVEEYVQLQGALMDSFKPTSIGDLFKGVPQGAPTSPFLSILILKEFLTQVPSISYADDPIFYSDKDFIIKDDPEKGIILNEEKSGGVKRDGVGLKPLKFLGLILNPDGTLESDTRKGRREKIQGSLIELLENLEYNEYDSYLESLAEKNIFGFIQACLFSGWDPRRNRDTSEKMIERMGKAHPDSLFGKMTSSLDSSSLGAMALAVTFRANKITSKKEDIYGK